MARAELTSVSVPFFGMDGTYCRSTVTVNEDVERDASRAFNPIASQRFPSGEAVPIENFGGSDIASERADITSAFDWIQPRIGAREPDAYWRLPGAAWTSSSTNWWCAGMVQKLFTDLDGRGLVL